MDALLTITEAQLLAWLNPLIWPMLRALAMLATMPVFNQRSVPMRVKAGLAMFVALAAQASLPPMQPLALDSPEAFAAALQQVVVGVVMGFAVRVVFAGIELAGELIGLQMGLNFAGFFDPVSASQGTATARFMGTLIGFMFILGGGHAMLIAALVRSFEVVPVGDAPLAVLKMIRPAEWGREIFVLGLGIALPLVGMLLFVNLVMGVMSRVAPQLNVFSIGFPVTLGTGLAGLLLTLPMMEQPFQAALLRMVQLFG